MSSWSQRPSGSWYSIRTSGKCSYLRRHPTELPVQSEASPRNQIYPRGFAPRTPQHALSLGASPPRFHLRESYGGRAEAASPRRRADRVARSLRSLALIGALPLGLRYTVTRSRLRPLAFASAKATARPAVMLIAIIVSIALGFVSVERLRREWSDPGLVDQLARFLTSREARRRRSASTATSGSFSVTFSNDPSQYASSTSGWT
jgi:hypothetical protein